MTGNNTFGAAFGTKKPQEIQPKTSTQEAPEQAEAVQPAQARQTLSQAARDSVQAMLANQFKAIQSIIPKHVDAQRLARIALIEFQRNPKLIACSPQSIVGCVLQAAMVGLEIGGSMGYCYMVPYKGQAQFQVGYKGLLKLARNTGELRQIDAGIVCQNDDFEFEKGMEPKCKVSFVFGKDRGPVIGYYACATFKDGGGAFEAMTKDEVLKFAKAKSRAFGDGPWQTDFDAMAIKTVIKRLSKWLPISESMAAVIAKDEQVLTEKVNLDVGEVITAEVVDTTTGEVTNEN